MSSLLLDMLQLVKTKLDSKSLTAPYRFLFLGYNDIHAPDNYYTDKFGVNALSRLKNRSNSKKLLSIHGRGNEVTCVPTISSVLHLLFDNQVTFDVFDFQKYEGNEIEVNLNFPVDERYVENYDFVIDSGTTEHIFDYAQCLKNCALMTKVGGYIYHCTPINAPNHGFYSISPTLYNDFYSDNGFLIELLRGVVDCIIGDKRTYGYMEIPSVDRFNLLKLPYEAHNQCLVSKQSSVHVFKTPIQNKYRDKKRWL